MDNEPIKKPPIGVHPRFIAEVEWLIERNRQLKAAMDRYADANRTIGVEWVEEYNYNIKQIHIIQNTTQYAPWKKD